MLFVFFGKKRKQIKQWLKRVTMMMISLSQTSVTLFLDDCFLIRGLSWECILSSSFPHLGLDLKPTNKGEPFRTAGEKRFLSPHPLSRSRTKLTKQLFFSLSERAGLSIPTTCSFGIEETDIHDSITNQHQHINHHHHHHPGCLKPKWRIRLFFRPTTLLFISFIDVSSFLPVVRPDSDIDVRITTSSTSLAHHHHGRRWVGCPTKNRTKDTSTCQCN